MQQAIKGVLAAFMIAGASTAASAVPATVETDLNIRSGPSTGYAVLDTMPGGALVDVVACYQGWCEIVWDGLDGFANRAYLDIASGVTVIQPPVGAILAPGIVVYETRYFERPIWSSRGHIIRQAIRRDIRRDLRQDRRQDRREVRQERREDRREVRQDRREDRADRARDARRELRGTRQDRADAVRERPRRIEDSRRSVERRSTVGSRARVQQQRVQEQRQQRREVRQERRNEAGQARQQRREVRQERRNEAGQARQQRERRETTGRGGR